MKISYTKKVFQITMLKMIKMHMVIWGNFKRMGLIINIWKINCQNQWNNQDKEVLFSHHKLLLVQRMIGSEAKRKVLTVLVVLIEF